MDDKRRERMMLLESVLVPCTKAEAVFWLARFVQHFPIRDIQRNSVVANDLAGDFIEKRLPVVAIINALTEIRRASSFDNEWMPPSGEILRAVINKANAYWNAMQGDKSVLAAAAS